MAGFDPSIISEIPTYAGNPMQAVSNAYNLKEQQFDVQGKVRERQEDDQIRSLLKQSDLSSFEGRTKAAEAITKISPEKGMKFMAGVQQQRTQQQNYDIGQLEQAAQQAEQLGTGLDSVAVQIDQEAQALIAKHKNNPVLTDQDKNALNAKTKLLVIPAALQLRNSNPALAQYVDKAMQDPASLTYDGFMNIVGKSKEARARLTQEIARRKLDYQESEAAKRDAREQRKLEDAEKKAADQKTGADVQEIYGAMADKGISFPPGMRSVKAQRDTVMGLRRKHPDDSPDQIAERIRAGELGFKEAGTEVTTLAKQKANLSRVEKSIVDPGGFLEQAEQAVTEVDLGRVKSLGKLNNWRLDEITDPALQNYHSAVTELRAEYAIVLAKGGTMTNEARNEAEKVVPDYMTPGSFARIKQRVEQGIGASTRAVDASIEEATHGKPSTPAGAPPAGGPPPTAPATGAPAGGAVAPFKDPEKERRYQEWKRTHPNG